MVELEPNAKAILADARRAVSPSAEDIGALHARLGLGAPPPSSPPPAEAAANAGPSLVRRVVIGGVAAAMLVAGGLALTSSPADSHVDVPAPVESSTTKPRATPSPATSPERFEEPEPSQPATLVGEADALPPLGAQASAATSAETSAEASDVPDRAPERRPRPRRRPPAPDAPRSDPADDLQAELALIVKARKALASGHYTQAQTLAREYGQRFADGSFGEEATVLGLVASCKLGRDETHRATHYVDRASAAFADRVRKACLSGR